MPSFEYQVKDRGGKDQQGIQEAADVGTLVSTLRNQGFIIIRVSEVRKSKSSGAGKAGAHKAGGKSGNIKLDDLVVFSRQMATLVGAGIPLIQALDILAEQVEKEKFRLVLRDMHREVQGGKSFSGAMEKHHKIFSALFINMVRAGEQSGSLEEILDRIASYFEKTSALQKKVKSALMYPMVIMCMAVITVFVLVVFVLPKFEKFFAGFHKQLPLPTRILLGLSGMLSKNFVHSQERVLMRAHLGIMIPEVQCQSWAHPKTLIGH